MADHDKTHKLFFTHPRLVREFFLSYLPREWTERMDFSSLERVHSSLISRDLSERHGDRVWRVRWHPGEGENWCSFYLMIEFQSRPDPLMTLRLHNYVGHLLEDLARRPCRRGERRLPIVVPLVLYDGTRPWTAPLDLYRLCGPVPESLRRHLPQLEPLFVDERRSAPADDLATLFFQINTSRSPQGLAEAVAAVARRLPRGEEPELRRDFLSLILRVMHEAFPGVTIPTVADLEELPMFAQSLIHWRNRVIGQAVARGRVQGQRTGEIDGMRAMLLRQLKGRFGPLPLKVRRQLKAIATREELESLADRVIVAKSLEELDLS
jgi:predicted transposase YdaD